MTAQLTSAIARIRQANERFVGAGFLVSDKHILTCAHVVNAALSRSLNTPDKPSQEVCLDFPLVASGNILKGRVVQWIPVQSSASISPETGADIALLELEGSLPEEAQPIRLVAADNLWKHPFRVFGFPEGQAVGVWTDGIISNPQANGRVQIEVVRATAYPIEPGFSGSPVWDEQLDGVAGMTVAIDSRRPEVRAAFIIPTTQLINACPELEEQAIPPCPYRGLFAFREQDAKFFFGRETFTQKLLRAVQKQSLVAIIGASGSGKSSVVFASLIPQLRSEEGWLIESFRPGDRPLRNLVARLIPLLETEMSETDQLVEVKKQTKALQQRKLELQDVARRILEKNSGSRLLLIADQFEELYTLCQDNSERQIFLDQLLEAVKQTEHFKLVLTLRADFFGYALSYRPFADALQDADRKLGPMNRVELQEAINKPAQLLGVRFESGLTERILEAVEDESGNLPLLEFALTLLWAKQQNGQLTHQAYEDIGGVEKALAEYAEKHYGSLNKEDKQRAQRVFIQLVSPGEGTEDTRRLATRDEVGEDNWDLVTRLASARLVVTNKTEKINEKEETDQETVEIIHEALIREWGELRQWMAVDRSFRTWQERLRIAMYQWEKTQRDEGALLRGVALAEAEEKLKQRQDDLAQGEQYFIKESVELRNRELEQREQRRRLVVYSLVAALGVTLSLGGLAGIGWRNAAINEIKALAQSSNGFLNPDGDGAFSSEWKAIQSSVKAGVKMRQLWGVDANTRTQVELALLNAVHNVAAPNTLGRHAKFVRAVSFSPNGKVLASASDDGTVKLWDASIGQEITTLTGHTNFVRAVSFSPDGKILASGSGDRTVKLWDTSTGKEIATLIGHRRQVYDVNFSPDGKILASGSTDNTVKLWDTSTGQEITTLTGHTNFVRTVSFSPDGKMLASGSSDDTVKLWDTGTGEKITTLTGHTDSVSDVDFSSDGKILASGSSDDTVKLWDTGTGKEIQSLTGHRGPVYAVSFSPDGKILASASYDRTIKLWDTTTGEEIQTLTGHRGSVRAVNFSPDGKILASASADMTVKLWDASIGQEMTIFSSGHRDPVRAVSFSPDGKILASGSGDRTVKLWDTSTGQEIQTLTGHRKSVRAVNFSPDGKILASASDDGTVKFWNLSTGQEIQTSTLTGYEDIRVFDSKFSPDGKILASASKDGTVKLWDTATGQKIITLTGHANWIYAVNFSPDGKILASASYDTTVKLWNVSTGQKIQTLTGHTHAVVGVSFSPDGKMLVSGSADDTVKLWDTSTGQEIQTLTGHTNSVGDVNFSPDGKMLASGSSDDTVKLWRWDFDYLLQEGCNFMGEYFKINPPDNENDGKLCNEINIKTK